MQSVQNLKKIGRNQPEFTVDDILKTYNSKNELVKIRYVASTEFLGQKIIDHDVCSTTIARGILK